MITKTNKEESVGAQTVIQIADKQQVYTAPKHWVNSLVNWAPIEGLVLCPKL